MFSAIVLKQSAFISAHFLVVIPPEAAYHFGNDEVHILIVELNRSAVVGSITLLILPDIFSQ